jgi:hypothetical protein
LNFANAERLQGDPDMAQHRRAGGDESTAEAGRR